MSSAVARFLSAPISALLLFETFALILRAWLQIELQDRGHSARFSADASYLVVPPLLVAMAWPLLSRHRPFLRQQFSISGLSLRTAVSAVAIGVLLRLAWWTQLVAGGMLGLHQNRNPDAIEGPLFTFACPPSSTLALHLLVMALLVPLVEEIINRGFFLRGLLRWGPAAAIIGSSILFGIFHQLSSITAATLVGIAFGVLAWRSGSLWPSLIAHATYNALIALDWMCLQGLWNPQDLTWMHRTFGVVAAILFALIAGACLWLGWRIAPPPARTAAQSPVG